MTILERTGPTSYKLAHSHNGQELKYQVHCNRLKPFYHRLIRPAIPERIEADETEVLDIDSIHPLDRRLILNNMLPNTQENHQEANEITDNLQENINQTDVLEPLATNAPQPLPTPEETYFEEENDVINLELMVDNHTEGTPTTRKEHLSTPLTERGNTRSMR